MARALIFGTLEKIVDRWRDKGRESGYGCMGINTPSTIKFKVGGQKSMIVNTN